MDGTIAALQAIRSDIENQEISLLEERLQRARQGREKWFKQRQASDWINDEAVAANDVQTGSAIFGRLLGLGRKPKPKK
jgi:hypothetical protein